jgi:hypothetical protein
MAEFFCDDPTDISDLASKDVGRIVGAIAKALAANAPYMNVIGGGTFPSGVSDEIRSVVQMQAAPGDSLALPVFYCDTDMCGTSGHQDKTATVEFATRLESFRGRGPNICVKKGYAAFKGSYTMAEDALKKLMTQYINADIRAQLYLRSASKFVANAAWDFDSLFTGGWETDLGVQFFQQLPTGPMTFKALHYIARYMREVLFAEWYAQDKGMPHFRFIGGSDQVEYFRNEVGIQNVAVALTSGGYDMGKTVLTAYGFEQSPAYRGIAFGVDQRPLRCDGFNMDGTLHLLDPVTLITDAAKGTAYAKPNPAWLNADYEVGILIADGSFERLVPERYVGEGSFKFSPQLHMGELEWHYVIDNQCNQWGDFGWHRYQITRAYKPLRPQHIVPILYKRCKADLGLVDCVVETEATYTGGDSYTDLTLCDEGSLVLEPVMEFGPDECSEQAPQ